MSICHWKRSSIQIDVSLSSIRYATRYDIENVIPSALWSRTVRNPDMSTGPLTRPFAPLRTPLTCLLAPHCLPSLALHCAHLFACLLTRSRAHGEVMILCLSIGLFCTIVHFPMSSRFDVASLGRVSPSAVEPKHILRNWSYLIMRCTGITNNNLLIIH